MEHLKHIAVVFVNYEHDLLSSLLVGTFDEASQPVAKVDFVLVSAIE
jgi:hypothetical protein